MSQTRVAEKTSEPALENVPMDDDKESICKVVASLTPGLVAADLENIVQVSVLIAAIIGGKFVIKGLVIGQKFMWKLICDCFLVNDFLPLLATEF
ncbi:hypothetical protein L1987_37273 [Smallanthus sonchifolius]|uniref:Uncharacterized protein n=1 Tax=Smallanthus sonchifolius TaxID=185202 RepID=A0ACB9HFX2_9ASTR|nr:hypothetical protein L1987_37273 [Smallanthus sonchifolius]